MVENPVVLSLSFSLSACSGSRTTEAVSITTNSHVGVEMPPSNDSPADSGVYTEHPEMPPLPNWMRMPEYDEVSYIGDASVIMGAVNQDAINSFCD